MTGTADAADAAVMSSTPAAPPPPPPPQTRAVDGGAELAQAASATSLVTLKSCGSATATAVESVDLADPRSLERFLSHATASDSAFEAVERELRTVLRERQLAVLGAAAAIDGVDVETGRSCSLAT